MRAKKLTIAAIVEDGSRDLKECFYTAVTQVQMARAKVIDGEIIDDPLRQQAERVQKWLQQCPVSLSDAQFSLLVDYLGCVHAENYQAMLSAEAQIRAVMGK